MRLQKRVWVTTRFFCPGGLGIGFTLFLPTEQAKGSKLNLELLLQGDFMFDPDLDCDCHYPRSTTSWFPRHGYLDRATFNLTFRHAKKLRIASVGKRLSEEPDPELKEVGITKYELLRPVPFVTFALAPFERHSQMVKWEKGGVGEPIPVEFNSLPGSIMAIKEDFILAEMDNSLRYFTSLFGKYPYPVFGGAFHPFHLVGASSLLMIPTPISQSLHLPFHHSANCSSKGMGLWRSYRDQWLSEGLPSTQESSTLARIRIAITRPDQQSA